MAGEDYLKIAAAGMCMCLLLSACQKDSDSSAPVASAPRAKLPASAKKGPTVEELTAGMVTAAPIGKSTLPLDLKFDLANRPAQGQSLEINLAMVPQLTGGTTDLQLSGTDGFSVADSTPFEVPAVEEGQVYRHTIQVTPTAQGLLLLGITVAVKHDDQTDSRTFNIPVIVDR